MAAAYEMNNLERHLRTLLRELPSLHNFKYSKAVKHELINTLFSCLAAYNTQYLNVLFPNGLSSDSDVLTSLQKTQGAVEGAEYTEAARGHPCGHVFKIFEPSYHCRTCAVDGTCVLCARCFEASDHSGHSYTLSLNHTGGGCCDCGDPEAWKEPPPCAIHSPLDDGERGVSGKGRANILPEDFAQSIKTTISIVMDYFTDVWSCAPEQLRHKKTAETIQEDETSATLVSDVYGGPDPAVDGQYALVLWNDEKHNVTDVAEAIMRAIRTTKANGRRFATEIDEVGRVVVKTSNNIADLLHATKIIEDPRLSVSIRSCRDIFREEMTGTIIEWLADINGCAVGPDSTILKNTICDEFLGKWKVGMTGPREVGKDGIYDHDREEIARDFQFDRSTALLRHNALDILRRLEENWGPHESEEATSPVSDESFEDQFDFFEDELEAREATMAGYPPPPPPPSFNAIGVTGTVAENADAADGLIPVPRTPHQRRGKIAPRPPKYWVDKPSSYSRQQGVSLAEDLWQRTRLDYLLLFDMRMWKNLRINLRELLVRTVVSVPTFKRLVALRFSSIYTVLAELHLIADREPDHSLLYLTLQLLTTPSITAEIVQKGNFLTNLLAIIYTFLTTRQVGYPGEVNLSASFAIDQGVSFNRRSTCFYSDLKYLMSSEVVRDIVHAEPRYLMQFFDLVKIHQGLCPNVRAVEQHVEYEMEQWMNILSVMTEIFRLCRTFSESYKLKSAEDVDLLLHAIKQSAATVIFNSLGMERRRFEQSEFKRSARFKLIDPLEFENRTLPYRIIDFSVDSEPISCYHPLHYMLSWLIAEAKALPAEMVREKVVLASTEVRILVHGRFSANVQDYGPKENALAMFDIPIRVLAWLAQARTGMWVRNGQSLRSQLQHYKNVVRRDIAHARDIFLLQAAFVLCEPDLILCSLLDRFDLLGLVRGDFDKEQDGREMSQVIDMAEDLVHLLIIILCDRSRLIPCDDEDERMAKQEIIHALCVKPLAYHEFRRQISENTRELVEKGIIHQFATFKPPEGINDQGKFIIKEQFIEEIDPYSPLMSKNYREEAEKIWCSHKAKTSMTPLQDTVFEPLIESIPKGMLFSGIADFTSTALFAQMVFYFAQQCLIIPPDMTGSKYEQFYQFVLHLILVAVKLDETGPQDERETPSFCKTALTYQARKSLSEKTLAAILRRSMGIEHLKSCAPRVKLILNLLKEKRPGDYAQFDAGFRTGSEQREKSGSDVPVESEKDRKRRQAMDRQARVMEQMKQQQNQFLANQQIDWGVDGEDEDDDMMDVDERKLANYPEGECLVCKGEQDSPHYGTFAYVTTTQTFRNTPVGEVDDQQWIKEVAQVPDHMDRQLEERPFGVAALHKTIVKRKMHDGRLVESVRQNLGKGFPTEWKSRGVVSTGCGHVMHYSCWKTYLESVQRRHLNNITRLHPENLSRGEFQCPLCKALCNVFLPIVWKPKEMLYPGALLSQSPSGTLEDWLAAAHNTHVPSLMRAVVHNSTVEPKTFEVFGGPGLTSPWTDLYSERLRNLTVSRAGQSQQGESGSSSLDSEPPAEPSSSYRHPGAFGLPAGLNANFIEPQIATPLDVLGTNTALQNIGPILGQTLAALVPLQGNGTGVEIHLLNEPSLGQSQGRTAPPTFTQLESVFGRLLEAMSDEGHDEFRMEVVNVQDARTINFRHIFTLLGQTVSFVEISQRCPEPKSNSVPDSAKTVLDTISPITMMHLRVLGETIQAIVTVLSSSIKGQQRLAMHHAKYLLLQRLMLTGDKPIPELTKEVMNALPSELVDLGSEHQEYKFEQFTRNLLTDAFVLFTEMAICNMELNHDPIYAGFEPAIYPLDVSRAMEYFYLVEVVRVIGFFLYAEDNIEKLLEMFDSAQYQYVGVPAAFPEFVETLVVADIVGSKDHHYSKLHLEKLERLHSLNYAPLYLAIRKYALPFVRKCVVFMHAKYNIDFDAAPATEAHDWAVQPELEKLSALLLLPTLEQLFQQVLSKYPTFIQVAKNFWLPQPQETEKIRELHNHFMDHMDEEARASGMETGQVDQSRSPYIPAGKFESLDSKSPDGEDEATRSYAEEDIKIKFLLPKSMYLLGHPGVYELVSLPKEFVVLQETATKAKCPTTGNPITDPVVCLDCGAVICSQTICCMKKRGNIKVGGIWQHREK
jgi:E3 ubiquitin-protein ligase UBR1